MPVVVPELFVAAKTVTLQQREIPQKPVVLLPPLRVTATATTFDDYGKAQTVMDAKAPVVDTTPSVPRKRSRSQPVVRRRRRRTVPLFEPLELSPLPPRRPELPPEARGSGANPRCRADDDASEDTCFTAKPPVPRFPKKLNIAGSVHCDVEERLARRRSPSRKKAVSKAAAVSHRYFTFAFTKTADGRKVPLENRHRVVLKLHQLNTDVAMPIAKRFNLRYSYLSEQPPDARKAGVTIREVSRKPKQQQQQPETEEGSKNTGRRRRSDAASISKVVVEEDEGPKYLNHIRVRIRPMVRPELGEPLLSDSTLMAVLFHELAHIRYMNHGLGFMRFLREVYLYATDELKIFHVGEPNELPSPWSWERRIYETGGRVSEGELLREFGRRSTEGPPQAQNLENAPAEADNEISVTCFNSSGRC
ncbi:hypothetical protein FOZ61_006754 [Perkinsus olseni]|uniref:WLM domain-containing protein n=1 Tax=Perkinsus olseni TaxID=32597 RepID=A0A7J6LP82_PEROL|nr:hypothetical protein FOZ61_006754 [Perkinsus olseni]KAF4661099.1 hypothetical protein FOL46_005863 [Perkinsus olseni]